MRKTLDGTESLESLYLYIHQFPDVTRLITFPEGALHARRVRFTIIPMRKAFYRKLRYNNILCVLPRAWLSLFQSGTDTIARNPRRELFKSSNAKKVDTYVKEKITPGLDFTTKEGNISFLHDFTIAMIDL